jgi:hypothetical protein
MAAERQAREAEEEQARFVLEEEVQRQEELERNILLAAEEEKERQVAAERQTREAEEEQARFVLEEQVQRQEEHEHNILLAAEEEKERRVAVERQTREEEQARFDLEQRRQHILAEEEALEEEQALLAAEKRRQLILEEEQAIQDEYNNLSSFQKVSKTLEEKLHFKATKTLLEAESRGTTLRKTEVEEEVIPDRIGVVAPSLRAMISLAAMELRPVPEEHKVVYKPVASEASEIGQFKRLREVVVEAYGTPKSSLEKEVAPKFPAWSPGRGTVEMPKYDNRRSGAFMVVQEAAALGRMKKLKANETTNYDPQFKVEEVEEVDVDDIVDEHGRKDFRHTHLTDIHIKHHKEGKAEIWDPANIEQNQYEYRSIDEVDLPTETLPVYATKKNELSKIEYLDSVSKAVAERSWDRRYRLDRPGANQKIRNGCSCSYCHHPNPYQTHAYRKKWLVQQGLWVEPPKPEPEPVVIQERTKGVYRKKWLVQQGLLVDPPEPEPEPVVIQEERNDVYRKKWLVQQGLWGEPPEQPELEPDPKPEPEPKPVVIQDKTKDSRYEGEEIVFEEEFDPIEETYPEEANRRLWVEQQGLSEDAMKTGEEKYTEEQEEFLEEPSPELHPVEEEDNKETVNAEQDVRKDNSIEVDEEAAVESKEKDAVEISTSRFSQNISRTLSWESTDAKSTNPTEEDQTLSLDTVPAKEADTPAAKPTTAPGSAFSVNTLDSVEPVVENDRGDATPKATEKESVGAANNEARVGADDEANVETKKEEAYEMKDDHVVVKDSFGSKRHKEIRNAKRKERSVKKKEKRSARKSQDTSKKFFFF